MIKLELDEGFCFDLLSIAEVKFDKTRKESASDNFFKIRTQIMNQIGNENTYLILDSKEYDALYSCNAQIFDLVDEIKKNPTLLASIIDDMNYKRFELKKILQDKFFPQNKFSEQKIGYKENQ